MVIMAAQETLLQTIRDFLVEDDLDATEFDGEAQVITYATEKDFNARNLPGTALVIGDRSAVTDAGRGRRPGSRRGSTRKPLRVQMPPGG